jgi:hypothetical protein
MSPFSTRFTALQSRAVASWYSPDSPFMLALKLLLLPSLICGLTLAGRRWGPAVAGWLSGLPIVAGPILFFISIEQGPAFGAAAAEGTLSGLVAVLAFIVGYAWTATRTSWLVSALMGWFAYAVAVGLIYLLEPQLVVSAVVDVLALWYAPRLLPKIGAPAIVAQLDYSEIAVRMFAGVALLLALTYFASGLGPRLSGLLAMFPTLGTVLAIFSHRHAGAEFAIHLLRGMVLGLYAFVAFTVVLALSLTSFRTGTAFAFAIGSALVVQGIARIFVDRGVRNR